MKGQALMANFDRMVPEKGHAVDHSTQDVIAAWQQEGVRQRLLQRYARTCFSDKLCRADQTDILFEKCDTLDGRLWCGRDQGRASRGG